MLRKITPLLACLGVFCAMLTGIGPACAQGKKLVLGLPGIPPIFGTVIAYVAQDEGFWKKLGVDVELRRRRVSSYRPCGNAGVLVCDDEQRTRASITARSVTMARPRRSTGSGR